MKTAISLVTGDTNTAPSYRLRQHNIHHSCRKGQYIVLKIKKNQKKSHRQYVRVASSFEVYSISRIWNVTRLMSYTNVYRYISRTHSQTIDYSPSRSLARSHHLCSFGWHVWVNCMLVCMPFLVYAHFCFHSCLHVLLLLCIQYLSTLLHAACRLQEIASNQTTAPAPTVDSFIVYPLPMFSL